MNYDEQMADYHRHLRERLQLDQRRMHEEMMRMHLGLSPTRKSEANCTSWQQEEAKPKNKSFNKVLLLVAA